MSSFIGVLPHYTEAFLRLFFPSVCAFCNQLLELNERGLCHPCKRNVQKCKLLSTEEHIRTPLSFTTEGWALFRYEDSIKDLFHHIKFQGRRDLIRLFDEDLFDFLNRRRREFSSYNVLIPIPLDRRRRVEREYNQSALLAKKIAPADIYYHHNDLAIRTENLVCDQGATDCLNGHSHMLHLLMGAASETISFSEKKLGLGTWQRIFLVELDVARKRDVLVKVLGE